MTESKKLVPPLRTLALLALLGLLPQLQGCVEMAVVGAGAAALASDDRRSLGAQTEDKEIDLNGGNRVSARFGDKAHINVTSYNRNVLLTGQADDDVAASRAAALVAALPKVERVIDEVSVGPPISLTQESRDVFITSQAKIALAKIDLPGFDPTRVKVVTEDAVVYLMGLVSPEEGDASAERVRFVPGVKRVVKLFEHLQPESPGAS